jgi:hypothetical protein
MSGSEPFSMSRAAESDPVFTSEVDAGVVLMRWMPGAHITGPVAAEAMDTVDQLNGAHKRPLLVDMTGTAKLTGDARATFQRDCQVSRMAIVGTSAVDKVIANFGLRVSVIDMPSRFFTSVSAALSWLRDHEVTFWPVSGTPCGRASPAPGSSTPPGAVGQP